MHRMYRVRTTRGDFAVKALNPNELQNPGARDRFRLSERLAARVAAACPPAVAALMVAGDALFDLGPITVLVYPWIEGQVLSSTSAGPERAGLIGRILGRIHTLPLHFAALEAPASRTFSEVEWTLFVEEAHTKQAAWADELRVALPDLARWGRALSQAQRALPNRTVVSHADLHQQNVLWSNEHTPHLIDWESAGMQRPAKEAVVSALEWSGFVEGDPDVVTFRAFLEAYRREAPLSSDEVRCGLDACFGNWIGWLHLNVRRALGVSTSDLEEQALGARQIVGTLATIRHVEASFPTLAAAGK
jgi:Ser/Thr protein kinase RdoA (MazF antagonist)